MGWELKIAHELRRCSPHRNSPSSSISGLSLSHSVSLPCSTTHVLITPRPSYQLVVNEQLRNNLCLTTGWATLSSATKCCGPQHVQQRKRFSCHDEFWLRETGFAAWFVTNIAYNYVKKTHNRQTN